MAQTQGCEGPQTIFDNWNTGIVDNGGTSPEIDLGSDRYCLTHIATYHWNGGAGKTAGVIGVRTASGINAAWQAVGTPGQNDRPNVNWEATPSGQPVILTGKVTVTDSDPATWSQNAQSGRKGFARLWVRKAGGFSIRATTFPAGRAGAGYNWPVTADGATGTVDWVATGLPPGLQYDRVGATTIVTGVPSQAGDYNLTLKATDRSTGATDTKIFPITIAAATAPPPVSGDKPRINKPELKPANIGQDYLDTFTAEGGTPPYMWAFVSGFLPPGIDLRQDGTLRGITDQRGQFTFVVQATDRAGQKSDPKEYSIFVFQQVTITRGLRGEGTVGTPYEVVLEAIGGTAPYRWTCRDLPPGVVCDPLTGKVTGIPTTPGTYPVKVTATDKLGLASKEEVYAVRIVDSSFRITSTTLKPGKIGLTYNDKIQTSGGSAGVKIKLIGGNLPKGLTLGEDGTVSGTPVEGGSVKVRVQADDPATGKAAQGDITIPIASNVPLGFKTESPLPSGRLGESYGPIRLETEGGCPPPRSFATVAVSPFNPTVTLFPSGLLLDRSTGVLSGIPLETVERDVMVEVTDDCGSARKPFHIRIDAPRLSVDFGGPTARTVVLDPGSDKTVTIEPKVSGGTPPYTFDLPGVAPTDPRIDSFNRTTGKVTFRFGGTGIFQYDYVVRDKNGVTVSTALQFTVRPPPFKITGVTNILDTEPARELAGHSYRISFFKEGTGSLPIDPEAKFRITLTGERLTSTEPLLVVDHKDYYQGNLRDGPILFEDIPLEVHGKIRLEIILYFREGNESARQVKLTVTQQTGAGAGQSESTDLTLPAVDPQTGMQWRFVPKEPDRSTDPDVPGYTTIPMSLEGTELFPNLILNPASPPPVSVILPRVTGTQIEALIGGLPPGAKVLVRDTDATGIAISNRSAEEVDIGGQKYASLSIFDDDKAAATWKVKKSNPAIRDRYYIPFWLALPVSGPASFPITLTTSLGPTNCVTGNVVTTWPCYRQNPYTVNLNIDAEAGAFADSYLALISDSASRQWGSSLSPRGSAYISGYNLSATSAAIASGEPARATLADRRVTIIDAVNTAFTGPVISVAPREFVFVVPLGVAEGEATVTITDTVTSSPVASGRVPIVRVSPGLFFDLVPGKNPDEVPWSYARGEVKYSDSSGSVLSRAPLTMDGPNGAKVANPVKIVPQWGPTEITLFATGIRNSKPGSVVVTVAGKPVPVIFSGQPADTLFELGIEAIQFSLAHAQLGLKVGPVNVEVTAEGKPANVVTLFLDPSGDSLAR